MDIWTERTSKFLSEITENYDKDKTIATKVGGGGAEEWVW